MQETGNERAACAVGRSGPAAAAAAQRRRAFMLMLDLKLRVANKTLKKKSGDKREKAGAL